MRVAVIGASGLVGRAASEVLAERGHELRRVSRTSEYRADLRTGDGLSAALDGVGVEVVVNASNGPASGRAAGVLVDGTDRILAIGSAHHLCVSIVGVDALAPHSAYYRVKVEQEARVRRAGVPYTILRATQLHEYLARPLLIARRLRVRPRSSAQFASIASRDLALAIADTVEAGPRNETINVAGPQTFTLSEMCPWRGIGVPLPLPPGLGRALKTGAATVQNPEVRGQVSWTDWLQTHAS